MILDTIDAQHGDSDAIDPEDTTFHGDVARIRGASI